MRAAVFCRPSRPDALCGLIQGLRASRLPLATFFRAFGARRIPTLRDAFRATHTNARGAAKALGGGAEPRLTAGGRAASSESKTLFGQSR